MARRIMFALLCTIALLGAARLLTSGKPRDVYIEDGDTKIWHRTVTEHIGRGQPMIDVLLETRWDSNILLHYRMPNETAYQKRQFFFLGNRRYNTALPPGEIGDRIRYAIVLTRADGSTVRLPKTGHYTIKFKGRASPTAVAAHVVCMFAAFFFMVLSVMAAFRILRRGEGKRSAVNAARWALLWTFIGTWPLGLLLNWQTFGVLWEGYPFGRDITDNKTQIIFVFWLASLLLVRGSFLGRGAERDRLGPKGFAWAIVASFAVSLALYLLPHSL